MIIEVTLEDAEALTNIALESKAIWDYTEEQVESWREDLTITDDRIRKCKFYKFLQGEHIVGFHGVSLSSETTVIEFLFVSPKFIGNKIGHRLLEHVFYLSRKKGVKEIIVLSDPNAQSFYEKYGFKKFKAEESSIKGRFLPWLK
jgi:N-acetylglutamate synthase-like GNAT family acetyltransferase